LVWLWIPKNRGGRKERREEGFSHSQTFNPTKYRKKGEFKVFHEALMDFLDGMY
jgi:hypothetical protein